MKLNFQKKYNQLTILRESQKFRKPQNNNDRINHLKNYYNFNGTISEKDLNQKCQFQQEACNPSNHYEFNKTLKLEDIFFYSI